MDPDLQKAQHLLDLHRPAEAEALLRSLLAQDPDAAAPLNLLTQALLGTNRTAEVVAVATRAVAADPDSEHPHRLLAFAELEAGNPVRAEKAAREAVALAPNLWQTHYTLGMALHRCHGRQLDALASAREAVRLAPHESAPHNLAGMCLSSLGHRGPAQKEYEEAIRLDPTDAMAINNLAALNINSGRLAAAGAMLRSGLGTAPHEKILQQNYDTLLLVLVQRLYFALVLTGLVLYFMADGGAPYPVRAGTSATLLLVYLGASRLVTRNLPRGAHLWVRGLFKRITAGQVVLVVGFLALTVVVIGIGLAPSHWVATLGLSGWLLVRLGVVIGLAGAARGRRKHKQSLPPNSRSW